MTIKGSDLKAGDRIDVLGGHPFTVASVEDDDPTDIRFMFQDAELVAAEAILVRAVGSPTYYHLWRGESYQTV